MRIYSPQTTPIADSYIRLGYSKKGWIDGELGMEWIKHFDIHTHSKADKRARLLLLDGHNPHYTLEFLQYARTANIIVLCYSSHSTHIYQGLDVVIFAILKRLFIEERDKFESIHHSAVTKETFLGVLGLAYVRAVTTDNVKTTFCKTWCLPFQSLCHSSIRSQA